MKTLKTIIMTACVLGITSFCASAQSASRYQGHGRPSTGASNISGTLQTLETQIQELEAKANQVDSLKALSIELAKEKDNYQTAFVNCVYNYVYDFLRMPYNKTQISGFLNYCKDPKRYATLLQDKDLSTMLRQLENYENLNASLLEMVKKINAYSKDPGDRYKVKDSVGRNGTLDIDNYQQINEIPYLKAVISYIEKKINKFDSRSEEDFDEVVFILSDPIHAAQ